MDWLVLLAPPAPGRWFRDPLAVGFAVAELVFVVLTLINRGFLGFAVFLPIIVFPYYGAMIEDWRVARRVRRVVGSDADLG